MPSSFGLNRQNGEPLSGWDHVVQSIWCILTTPIGSRIWHLDFGSEVPSLVDAQMTPLQILKVYQAVAMALAQWEPRFELTRCKVTEAGPDGRITLEVYGHHMPRGHLGDRTIEASRSAVLALPFVAAA